MMMMFLNVTLYSQTNEKNMSDTLNVSNSTVEVEFSSLVNDFYATSFNWERSFNYELINKKRRLEMRAGEIMTLGWVCGMAVMFVNGYLAVDYEWNLWVDIPCATVLVMGTMGAFFYWSNQVDKKAQAIDINGLASVPVGDKYSFELVSYQFDNNNQHKSLGIGLTYNLK